MNCIASLAHVTCIMATPYVFMYVQLFATSTLAEHLPFFLFLVEGPLVTVRTGPTSAYCC